MEKQIEEIKIFNHFYTGMMIAWEKSLLFRGYSIREIKTLFEIHRAGPCSARHLTVAINTGKGQMSRLLMKLKDAGLIKIKESPEDRRYSEVSLSEKGEGESRKFSSLFEKAIRQQLTGMKETQREELIGHLRRVKELYKLTNVKKC